MVRVADNRPMHVLPLLRQTVALFFYYLFRQLNS